MGLEAVIEYAKRDDAWADLYALYRYLFECGIENELAVAPKYYYYRVEQGFERPSFMLKYVNLRPIPKNHYMQWYEGAMQLSFFTENPYDATLMLHKIQRALAPVRDVILPKYDFTTEVPTPFEYDARTPDGELVCGKSGARIDPTTVSGTVLQEPDERWQTIINFTLRSPRLEPMHCNVLKEVKLEYIGPAVPNYWPPLILDAGVSTTSTTETTE